MFAAPRSGLNAIGEPTGRYAGLERELAAQSSMKAGTIALADKEIRA